MYFKVTFNFTPRVTAETQKTWGESRNLTESHSKADEGSESVCGFFVKSWWETTRHVVVLVEEKLDSRLKPKRVDGQHFCEAVDMSWYGELRMESITVWTVFNRPNSRILLQQYNDPKVKRILKKSPCVRAWCDLSPRKNRQSINFRMIESQDVEFLGKECRVNRIWQHPKILHISPCRVCKAQKTRCFLEVSWDYVSSFSFWDNFPFDEVVMFEGSAWTSELVRICCKTFSVEIYHVPGEKHTDKLQAAKKTSWNDLRLFLVGKHRIQQSPYSVVSGGDVHEPKLKQQGASAEGCKHGLLAKLKEWCQCFHVSRRSHLWGNTRGRWSSNMVLRGGPHLNHSKNTLQVVKTAALTDGKSIKAVTENQSTRRANS